MAAVVVTRYRECNTLLTQVSAQLSAMGNFTAQRITVQSAMRRMACSCCQAPRWDTFSVERGCSDLHHKCCVSPHTPTSASNTQQYRLCGESMGPIVNVTGVMELAGLDRSVPLCVGGPLGVLRQFSVAICESIVSQHDYDINSILRSLNSTVQLWQKHLTSAKQAINSCCVANCVSDASSIPNSKTPAAHSYSQSVERLGGDTAFSPYSATMSDSQIVSGSMGLLAAMSAMCAVLRELVLALRHDAANDSSGSISSVPLFLVELTQRAQFRETGNSQPSNATQSLPSETNASFTDLLDKLPAWLLWEWDRIGNCHLADEARIMLAL